MDEKQIFEIKTTNKREDQALRYDLTVSKTRTLKYLSTSCTNHKTIILKNKNLKKDSFWTLKGVHSFLDIR